MMLFLLQNMRYLSGTKRDGQTGNFSLISIFNELKTISVKCELP